MKLRTLAIAAYEKSPLNEKDLEEQALLVNEIALYLARFGVEKEAVNLTRLRSMKCTSTRNCTLTMTALMNMR